jgi:hypothetical protein
MSKNTSAAEKEAVLLLTLSWRFPYNIKHVLNFENWGTILNHKQFYKKSSLNDIIDMCGLTMQLFLSSHII